MKNFLEKIRSPFATLGAKFKRKPKDVPAVNEPVTQPRKQPKRKADRFSVISWVVTILVVVALLGSTIYYKNSRPATYTHAAQPTSSAASEPSAAAQPQVGAPAISEGAGGFSSISRKLQLITNIPERPRYESTTYRVSRGDAMLSIAEDYKLKSETILYVNTQLEDNPHNLKPGMELTIPPVDGLFYTWKEGDTFETIAEKFNTAPDEIIDFPGNKVDLTDPKIDVGVTVMIPGGSRDLRSWEQDLATNGRGANTGTGEIGGNACGGGPVASGFGWPANSHNISGNGYGPGHLAIDIEANEGEPLYAAGAGIVTMAQGGWNYGYGNVVQIDHGNGYVTVYAHLSAINVGVCTPVGQGGVIGAAGNTGNSFGAHLHFEVRIGGSNVNPYSIVQ
jgi:murein DD-endopeptidase MepM/ murein hydrolase activator NlpD